MGRWSHRGAWRRLTAKDREIVDHCILLRDGRNVGEGRPQEVLTDSALRQFWGLS
ncbi:hypothetical protein [Streptomyces sp. CB02923]|uniref:hypothetical protein n=1 Tax=Streptomyces sp. CB02923 TaxID=1718985 RepID=UPI0019017F2D|nr:hypothetical protein [Streptomyces sp. CB02923]